MEDIKLLIIEDEPAQIQVYKDVIVQYNKKDGMKFTFNVCKNFEEGEHALKSPDYDAAIIDLKLSNSEELEGRKLVEAVYQKIRIPIVIYSGSIAQIDDIQENALLKKKLRTEKLTKVLDEIASIYKTGITTLLRPSGKIDEKLTQIFWDHLSKDIDTWIDHNDTNTLLRYILLHFQEHLEINLDGDFEDYHPFEVYIKPVIKKNLHTGDLIKYKGDHYLVLTPACDIVFQKSKGQEQAKRKAEYIVLVKAKHFEYETMCLDKNNKVSKDKISSFVKNNSYRYHYLPPLDGNNGYLVDFQDITSIPVVELNHMDRIATIAAAFIKDIISRFSNYYSRQGQPTFNQDRIIDELFNKTGRIVDRHYK